MLDVVGELLGIGAFKDRLFSDKSASKNQKTDRKQIQTPDFPPMKNRALIYNLMSKLVLNLV